MSKYFSTIICLFVSISISLAVMGKNSTYETEKDFINGNAEKIAISNHGELTLSQDYKQVHDFELTAVWSIAVDSKGDVYTVCGDSGVISKFNQNGKIAEVAKLDFAGIQAITIDPKDHVFVAPVASGKIYRIINGKPLLYFDTDEKYIYCLEAAPDGSVYVGTGDKGKIYKITGEKKGALIFDSDEICITALATDDKNNLYAGGNGKGRLYKISPQGKISVLLESGSQQISSISIRNDGAIYCSSVSYDYEIDDATKMEIDTFKEKVENLSEKIGKKNLKLTPEGSRIIGEMKGEDEKALSKIFLIQPNGLSRKIWKIHGLIIYSIVATPKRNVLVGCDEGKVFKVYENGDYQLEFKTDSQNVYTLKGTPWGVAVGTANSAKLLFVWNSSAKKGTYVSEVFDTESQSDFGQISWDMNIEDDCKIEIFSRQGNTAIPDNTWSEWSAHKNPKGDKIKSNISRYTQWKAELSLSNKGISPILEKVDISYLGENLAPEISFVGVSPVARIQIGQNVKFPSQRVISWEAVDPDNDELTYTVMYRRNNEKSWYKLALNLSVKTYSWNTRFTPDGNYEIKIVADDNKSNSNSRQKTGEATSVPFVIDNTSPIVSDLKFKVVDKLVSISGKASDNLSKIASIQYSLNGFSWETVDSIDKICDSREELFDFKTFNLNSGERTIILKVTDSEGNLSLNTIVVNID